MNREPGKAFDEDPSITELVRVWQPVSRTRTMTGALRQLI
jgi:hypothetical protein